MNITPTADESSGPFVIRPLSFASHVWGLSNDEGQMTKDKLDVHNHFREPTVGRLREGEVVVRDCLHFMTPPVAVGFEASTGGV